MMIPGTRYDTSVQHYKEVFAAAGCFPPSAPRVPLLCSPAEAVKDYTIDTVIICTTAVLITDSSNRFCHPAHFCAFFFFCFSEVHGVDRSEVTRKTADLDPNV